jgi:hypothetical protein
LQIIESGPIQSLDAFDVEQIPIGQQTRKHSVLTDSLDDRVEIRMKQRFSSAQMNCRRPEPCEQINAVEHLACRYWLREVVVFITVCTGKIAPPDRHHMHEDGMPRRL